MNDKTRQSRGRTLKNAHEKRRRVFYRPINCYVCGQQFQRMNPNHIYCGNFRKKTGCSYKVQRWKDNDRADKWNPFKSSPPTNKLKQ